MLSRSKSSVKKVKYTAFIKKYIIPNGDGNKQGKNITLSN